MLSSIVLFLFLAGLGLLFSLAHLADRERGLRWVVYLFVLALGAVSAAVGMLSLAAAAIPTLAPDMADAVGESGLALSSEALVGILYGAGVAMLVGGAASVLVLARPVRSAIARVLPIDPDRVVHALALAMAVHLVSLSAMVAVMLAPMLEDPALLDEMTDTSAAGGLEMLWAQGLGFAVLAALGVGLWVSRGGPETRERLGLVGRIDVRWWLAVTALGLASSVGVDALWNAIDPEGLAEVQRIGDALFDPYVSYGLAGALTIGLSAGLGEELLFRGAAQPRLGLLFTSLLFAGVHTQYTVSLALLQVLIVGLLLGVARQRSNTLTAIAAHATYNFVLAYLAYQMPELAP